MANTIYKKSDVVLKYENDTITVTGDGVKGLLKISSSELQSMYWSGIGHGHIEVSIKEE